MLKLFTKPTETVLPAEVFEIERTVQTQDEIERILKESGRTEIPDMPIRYSYIYPRQ